MNIRFTPLAVLVALAASPALAQSAGDWALGVGIHAVDPKSNSGALSTGAAQRALARIDSDTRPTLTLEYFIRDRLGIEILGAMPFRHNISLDGERVGSTKVLPPVLSLQYHFKRIGPFSPFVGVGANYTRFFGKRTQGDLEGERLDLQESWGWAGHVGVDLSLGSRYALRVDARKMGIRSNVSVNGDRLGKAEVDPWVYGAALVFKF